MITTPLLLLLAIVLISSEASAVQLHGVPLALGAARFEDSHVIPSSEKLSELPANIVLSKAVPDVSGNGAVYVENWRLASLTLSLAVVFFVSQTLELRVEKQLLVASFRCFIQLSALGLVLVPIINMNYPPLVLAYIMVMIVIAAFEASSRPPYTYESLFRVCATSLATTVFIFGTFTLTVVIGSGLDAQYAIPLVGMITGSSMSTVSVAISNVVTHIAERKANIEALLALGASRWEASKDIVRKSIVLGLTPTINIMSVTGLVTIPGMMTGQIIGGTSPQLAARYQMVIMFIIAGSSTVCTLLGTLLTINKLIDEEHQIRSELLVPRERDNQLGVVLSSLRDVASSLLQWRARISQRNSPFPSHVNDPPPGEVGTTIHANMRGGRTAYGALLLDPPSSNS